VQGTIGPDVALAALAVRRAHPRMSALAVLEACLREREGRVLDFGAAITFGSPFAMIVAEAFDRAEPKRDWSAINRPGADRLLIAGLRHISQAEVMPAFARHFDLWSERRRPPRRRVSLGAFRAALRELAHPPPVRVPAMLEAAASEPDAHAALP